MGFAALYPSYGPKSIKNESAVLTDIVLAEPMQALLTEAKNALGFNEGEYNMLIADIPNTPAAMPAVVIMAQTNSSQQTATARPHIMGICKVVPVTGQTEIFPAMYANDYLSMNATKSIQYIDEKTATISIIQQPKHGYLEPIMLDGDWTDSRYRPNDGYLGNDSFVMQVVGNGYKVKLHYFLVVTNELGVELNQNPICKGEDKGFIWKISSTPDTDTAIASLNSYIANITDGAYSISLPAAFLGIDRSVTRFATPSLTFFVSQPSNVLTEITNLD